MPVTVELGDLRDFVEHAVQRGYYSDTDALVRAALRLLQRELEHREDFLRAMEEEAALPPPEDALGQIVRANAEDALLRLINRYPRTPELPEPSQPPAPRERRRLPWLRRD